MWKSHDFRNPTQHAGRHDLQAVEDLENACQGDEEHSNRQDLDLVRVDEGEEVGEAQERHGGEDHESDPKEEPGTRRTPSPVRVAPPYPLPHEHSGGLGDPQGNHEGQGRQVYGHLVAGHGHRP